MSEQQYLDIAENILLHGEERSTRNGIRYTLFGPQMEFDLQKGFPLLTTKKMFLKGIIVELLWFLRGDTNIKYLQDRGVHIWDEWADENGDLGPVYGKQWRNWDSHTLATLEDEDIKLTNISIDQISNVINSIKNDPNSTRHIVTAWNPSEIESMALPPCHPYFQFDVAKNKLNCKLYQRSADWFLGVPFNIASYSLLTHIIAQEVGLQPGRFIHTFGNAHIYEDHYLQMVEQVKRSPYPFPEITFANKSFEELEYEDFKLTNYNYWPAIKGEVSI